MKPFLVLLKKAVRVPELYVLVAMVVLGVLYCMENVVGKNVKMTVDETTKDVVFPILENMEKGANFKVSFEIHSASGDYELRVVPDDCVNEILLNGEIVPIRGLPGLCDYNGGFVLDSSRIKPTGKDRYEFSVSNRGGPGGLNVTVVRKHSAWFSVVKYALLVCFVVMCAMVLKRLKFGYGVMAIILLGIVLRIFFVEALPGPNQFGHDVDGHISYVQYIVDNKALPSSKDCWTCYHPPLYFSTMAPVWASSTLFNKTGSEMLQLASFALAVATLIIGCLILRKILSGWPLYIGTALLTFWPVLVLSCSRIGNDQMFYLWHLLGLFGGISYLRTGKGKYILMASIACAFAVWTKSTGLITVAVCGLCLILGYFTASCSLKPRKSEVFAAVVFVAVLLGPAINFLLGKEGVVGNADGLNGALRIGNDFVNFLYFDVRQFLANPFTNPWDDNLGRQYFLNYMMKTSLFGEFVLLRDSAGRFVAQLVNISFLGLLMYGARGFWKSRFNAVNFILAFQLLAFTVALAYMRYKFPYACSNDFRYIIPALISVIPFVSNGMAVPGASLKWKTLGIVLGVVFVVSSVAVMLMVAAAL